MGILQRIIEQRDGWSPFERRFFRSSVVESHMNGMALGASVTSPCGVFLTVSSETGKRVACSYQKETALLQMECRYIVSVHASSSLTKLFAQGGKALFQQIKPPQHGFSLDLLEGESRDLKRGARSNHTGFQVVARFVIKVRRTDGHYQTNDHGRIQVALTFPGGHRIVSMPVSRARAAPRL